MVCTETEYFLCRQGIKPAGAAAQEGAVAGFISLTKRSVNPGGEHRKIGRLQISVTGEADGAFRIVVYHGSIHLQDGEECFAGHLNGTELAHSFLAFLLLFKEFLFTGDISAVALGQHVLAHGLDSFPGDYLAPYGSLNRDLKHLARNDILQFFGDAAALSRWTMMEKASQRSPFSRMSSFTRSLSR